MPNKKVGIYTTYAPETDMTFILCDTIEDGDVKSIECIGWYFGTPDDANTAMFMGSLKAEF